MSSGGRRSQLGMLSGEENIAPAEFDDSLWLFSISLFHVSYGILLVTDIGSSAVPAARPFSTSEPQGASWA